jgi:hypothetical protein
MRRKQWIAMLTLALCVTVTAGCGIEEVLEDVAQQLAQSHEQQAETEEQAVSAQSEAQVSAVQQAVSQPEKVTDSDLIVEQEQEALPEETVEPVDFTTLAPEACVEEQDGLPYIMLACDGADAINSTIESNFSYLVNDDTCDLHYECYKGAGRILSILIVQQYDGDARYYTPFNLDLQTGQWIDGQELLSLLGLSQSELAQAELSAMGNEFEYEFGAMQNGEQGEFYQQQYSRTVSDDNVDMNRLWFGAGGQLNFVAKLYPMAGAEYYEYPMSTGYYF